MEEKAKEVASLLKILSNHHRLLILCALEDGEKTVGELNLFISKIGMSALSQHLSSMKNFGLIDCDKRGQNVYYFITDNKILNVIHVLKDNYC